MADLYTPAEGAAVDALRGYAQVMIRAVAQVGRMVYTPEVEAFQRAWNDSRALIDKASAYNKEPPYWSALVADGLYGSKTAGALKFVIAPRSPPMRAADMPTWYTRNRDFVEALVPPQDTTAEMLRQVTAPLQETSAQDVIDPEALLEQAQRGGAVTTSVSASPAASEAAKPPGVMWCDELPSPEREMCWFNRHDITSAVAGGCREFTTPQGAFTYQCVDEAKARGVSQQVLDASLDVTQPATGTEQPVKDVIVLPAPVPSDIHVRAATTKGRTPLVAILVGGVALGGVLLWFVRPKRKRRRGR